MNPRRRRAPSVTLSLAAVLLVVLGGCGSAVVSSPPPTGSPVTASPAPSAAASQAAVPGVSASPASSASVAPPASMPSLPVPPEQGGPAFTLPPEMAPQDDDVCLVIVSRAAAEAALDRSVGAVEAQATDPTAQLTCIYPTGQDDWLLLTVSAVDVESEFQTDLTVATSHGQVPVSLQGIGDRAFYATATNSAPEQVVFTKGPVIVRLWNQTDATVGQPAFATLAGSAASAIEAEVRP